MKSVEYSYEYVRDILKPLGVRVKVIEDAIMKEVELRVDYAIEPLIGI